MSLVLSSAICRAETKSFTHYFHDMASHSGISFNPTNTVGSADEVTYTCSGGAKFWYDSKLTGGEVAIFLDASGEQVTTTKIQNLDSMRIEYTPSDKYSTMIVSISKDSSVWNDVTLRDVINGVKEIKMPAVDDYYVRFTRQSIGTSYNIYILTIKYLYIDLSDCPNCFIYKP